MKPGVICVLLVAYKNVYVHDLSNVRNCEGIVCSSVPLVAYALMCYNICPPKVGKMPQRVSGKEKIVGENAKI
jgi:hypothetical protein